MAGNTEQPLLATLQAEPALADGALYSPSEVLILASLRLPDPALQRLARTVAGWRLPAMEQDAFAYPTRVRLLQVLSEPGRASP